MTRRFLGVVLAAAVTLTGAGTAREPDEPEAPVRLKRKSPAAPKAKEKPAPDKTEGKEPAPEKARPGDDEPMPGGPPAPEADEEELLRRVAGNLQAAQERLAKGELGEPTRQVQEDILKDIDALLRLADRSQQPSGAPSEGSDGNQGEDPGGAQQQGGSQGAQQRSGKQRGSAASRSRQGSERHAGRGKTQAKPGPGAASQSAGGAPKGPAGRQAGTEPRPGDGRDGAGVGKSPAGAARRNADLDTGIWGHLPESLRAEMNAYFNDRQFMAKYDELIKRYYQTIAEKGRKPQR